MSVSVTKLKNGLTIVTDNMPHLESAAMGVWVKAGSRDEGVSEHGMAHLLEHMAFKGTTSRSAREIVAEIENVGGDLNASTSVETTAYYARVLKDDVPKATDILFDILANASIDTNELEREKHVILQEIGASLDMPDDIVFDAFQKTVFHNQPIGRTILGTPETVSSFSSEEIFDFIQTHYHGPNMVLCAAGAVDHDTLEDQTVTIRHRDTMEQQRVKIEDLREIIKKEVDVRSWLMRTK